MRVFFYLCLCYLLFKIYRFTPLIDIIVQARLGSTRFPNKIQKPLGRFSILSFQFKRLLSLPNRYRIICSTTEKPEDKWIIHTCNEWNISYYQGNEHNVLERYYETGMHFKSKIIVRLTSDCPLRDPKIIEACVDEFLKNPHLDYLSNAWPKRIHPKGMDVEVFTFSALEEAYKQTQRSYDCEHVTPYIYQHPQQFQIGKLHSHLIPMPNLSVDTETDYQRICEIFEQVSKKGENFSLEDIIDFVKSKQKDPNYAPIF